MIQTDTPDNPQPRWYFHLGAGAALVGTGAALGALGTVALYELRSPRSPFVAVQVFVVCQLKQGKEDVRRLMRDFAAADTLGDLVNTAPRTLVPAARPVSA